MNENAKVQRLVDELGCLISEWTVNGVSERVAQQFSDLYRRFMLTVHHDLGSSIDKGPALATAACIPLWEMLHFYSGAFAPLQASSKALVIILLTSLYPKARDRRCLYQHLGCVGSLGFSSVPLNWNVPTKTEVIEDLTSDGSEQDGYSEIVNYVQNTLLVEEEILKTCSTVGLGSKVKTLMEDVLPRCYLVDQDSNVSETGMPSESAIVITVGNNTKSPLHSFGVLKQILWKYLIFLHVYSPEDARKLGNFLVTSPWSNRCVRLSDGPKATYSSLIGPIVHEAGVCASLIGPCTNASPDNAPLLSPQLLAALLPDNDSRKKLLPETGGLSEPFILDKYVKQRTSITRNVVTKLHELLADTIPQELLFSNASNSCRDCDKLTLLCRNIMFSPVLRGTGSGGVSTPIVRRMLFDRKRGRDDGFYEGPAFLPVASSLSDLLSDGDQNTFTALERIAATTNMI